MIFFVLLTLSLLLPNICFKNHFLWFIVSLFISLFVFHIISNSFTINVYCHPWFFRICHVHRYVHHSVPDYQITQETIWPAKVYIMALYQFKTIYSYVWCNKIVYIYMERFVIIIFNGTFSLLKIFFSLWIGHQN